MPADSQTESRHGVMVCVHDKGLLITGQAGVGKSSLALELIRQGHQLIADDVVDLVKTNTTLTAYCPKLLKGLLHTRELGTLNIEQHFGPQAMLASCSLDFVIELRAASIEPSSLEAHQPAVDIMQLAIPTLCLSISNPASISNRLLTWLEMQHSEDNANQLIKQRQQHDMHQ